MRNFTLYNDPASAWKPTINARTIAPTTACKVGNRIYTTPYMAAKNEAWHMICTRYVKSDTHPKGLLGVKKIRRMQCTCKWGYHPWCSIHGRPNGYFARLHKRLTRQLAAKYRKDLLQ